MELLKDKLEASQLPSEQEVEWVCQQTEKLLLQEANIVELQTPQYVVGDIHGQFYDCLSMLAASTTSTNQYPQMLPSSSSETTSTEDTIQYKPSAICWS